MASQLLWSSAFELWRPPPPRDASQPSRLCSSHTILAHIPLDDCASIVWCGLCTRRKKQRRRTALILMANCLCLVRNSPLSAPPNCISSEISSPWVLVWIVSSFNLWITNSMEDLEMRPCILLLLFLTAARLIDLQLLRCSGEGSYWEPRRGRWSHWEPISWEARAPSYRWIRNSFEVFEPTYSIQYGVTNAATKRVKDSVRLNSSLPASLSQFEWWIGYVYLRFQVAPRFSSLWLLWGMFSLVHC